MATLSSASALVRGAALMADDLPDRIVLDDPDFLGLVVALLCLARRWSVFVMLEDLTSQKNGGLLLLAPKSS